jgi:hypothetical protein
MKYSQRQINKKHRVKLAKAKEKMQAAKPVESKAK